MNAKHVLGRARQENRTILTEIEAKQILMQSGINCTDTRLAATKYAAGKLSEQFGYPVVLKVSLIDITHKGDAGGVEVDLKSKAEVENAFDAVMQSCKAAFATNRIEGVSVQSMAKPSIEVIMGMMKDPVSVR